MKFKRSGLPAFVCLISLALILIFYAPFIFTASAAEYDQSLAPGDMITFGHYEQDNDMNNGAEAIQWRVLAREGDKALVITEHNLDTEPYNTSGTAVTWEGCYLRSWLNNDFLNAAFTQAQQDAILITTLKNEDNPVFGTDGGLDTSDKVFLLSIAEAENLFQSDEDRVAKRTTYAEWQCASTNDNGAGWWWLRSPGYYRNVAAYVYTDGSVGRDGWDVRNTLGAVRPALWLDLTSEIFTSEAP